MPTSFAMASSTTIITFKQQESVSELVKIQLMITPGPGKKIPKIDPIGIGVVGRNMFHFDTFVRKTNSFTYTYM